VGWGRFTLVQDRNSADILIYLSRSNSVSSAVNADSSVPVHLSTDGNDKKPIKINASESIVFERGKKYLTVDGNKVANLEQDPFAVLSGYKFPSLEKSFVFIDGRNSGFLYRGSHSGGSGKLVVDLKKRMEQK
jgi:hypothetical protein